MDDLRRWSVYKITNLVNGKVYVGKTYKTAAKRWVEHCAPKNKTKRGISSAVAKYGAENFSVEHVATCSSNPDACAVEVLLIAEYRSNEKGFGYNLTPGGNGFVTKLCPRGHDKDVVGRNSKGECLPCSKAYSKNRPKRPSCPETRAAKHKEKMLVIKADPALHEAYKKNARETMNIWLKEPAKREQARARRRPVLKLIQVVRHSFDALLGLPIRKRGWVLTGDGRDGTLGA